MISISSRVLAAAVAIAVVAPACGPAGGSGASPVPTVATTATTGMPSPTAATGIVQSLWSQREDALRGQDQAGLNAIEVDGARRADDAYLAFLACGCEQPKDAHALIAVVPVVPESSVNESFLAQVRTQNSHGDKVWYVIGVRRDAGAWKIGFLSVGWYKPAPPLNAIVKTDGYTLPVTESVGRRMARVASSTVPYAKAHNDLTSKTNYGADVRISPAVQLDKDGLYGLALRSGDVLACYTFHTVETYRIPGGYLQQSDGRNQWGPFLAPGVYRSIAIDNGTAECETGSGRPGTAGRSYLRYEPRVLATTGVSRS